MSTATIFAWTMIGLGVVALGLAIIISAEEDIIERRYSSGKPRRED